MVGSSVAATGVDELLLMGSERDQAQLFALSGKSKTLFKLLWIVIKKVISIKIRGLELNTI